MYKRFFIKSPLFLAFLFIYFHAYFPVPARVLFQFMHVFLICGLFPVYFPIPPPFFLFFFFVLIFSFSFFAVSFPIFLVPVLFLFSYPVLTIFWFLFLLFSGFYSCPFPVHFSRLAPVLFTVLILWS